MEKKAIELQFCSHFWPILQFCYVNAAFGKRWGMREQMAFPRASHLLFLAGV